MAAIENENIYGLKIRESANDGSDFSTPGADYRVLYLGEDGGLHLKDSAAAITGLGSGSGAAFPVSPNTNDRFWRTDLSQEFFYNGTRWLSTTLYRLTMHVHNFAAGTTYAGITGSLVTLRPPVPYLAGGSDLWLVNLTTQFNVSGGTALSASHKWVGTFDKKPTDDSNVTVGTITINSGSSSVWRTDEMAILALLNAGTTHYAFRISWTKTGTPGDLFAYHDLAYRIVAT